MTALDPAITGEIEPRSWSDVLELGSKIVAALLGTFYVLGILCVNAYVSGFGFTQYSLVESQYLFAGAWVAAFLTVSSFPILAAGALASKRSLNGSETIGRGTLAVLVLAIPFVLWYQFLKHLDLPGGRLDAAVTSIIFVTVIGVLAVTGFVLVAPLSPRSASRGQSWIKIGGGSLIVGSVFLAVLSFFIWGFAQFIYPRIPNRIGGGKPIRARLLLKHDVVDAIKTLSFEVPPNSDQSFPLDILFQTDKVAYIKTSSGTVLQINNDAVMGSIAKGTDRGPDWELWEVRQWERKVDGDWQSINDSKLKEEMYNCKVELFARAKIEAIDGYMGEDWICDSRCNGVVGELQQLEMRFANTKPNSNENVRLCFHEPRQKAISPR